MNIKSFNQYIQSWLTLLGRLVLGGVLFAAGYLKAKNPTEATASVRVYKLLPVSIANIFGYALPWIEIGIALLLIVGIWVKLSSILGGGLMVLFIFAVGQAWARKLAINCGCFGNGGLSADGKVHAGVYLTEILRDIGLTLIAGYLYRFPHGKFGLDKTPRE
ncbi:MAG: MauE/DoxX family redox-associated membrane protein [Actinomycetota bacterium]